MTVNLHLYGVVSSDCALPGDLVGRAEAKLRTVSDERLAVLVSDIDEEARVGRADLLAHAHALEQVAETCAVIPVQFGMVMPDEETVRRELLSARGDRTAALLRAFEGLVQLTVTARYDEDAALREVVRRDPSLCATPEAEADLQSRMRLGEAVAAALEALRNEDADRVLQQLAPHARGVALNEVRDAYTAASVALLVERSARAGLDRAVADLRRDLGRCEVRYVGPQPPYAFLDSVDTETSTWA